MTAPRVDSWCGGSAAPPAAREMQAISILHVIGDPTKTKAKDNIVKFRKRKEMAKAKKHLLKQPIIKNLNLNQKHPKHLQEDHHSL